MTNSRQKGKRYELKVAHMFKDEGYDARRSQQYAGMHGDADVVGPPGIHIECKAVERLQLYDAIAQSKHDARDGELPVVIHKKNNCADLVTMEFRDWIHLYREWEAGSAITAKWKPIVSDVNGRKFIEGVECTKCGYKFKPNLYHYCPNCGARITGGTNG